MTNYEANKETIELITLASGNWGADSNNYVFCCCRLSYGLLSSTSKRRLSHRKGSGREMIKRIDKQPSPKPCPFCGSEARIRDLYDVVDWTDDDEPITKRRFVCECVGVDCWVSPVTDAFDTEEEAIEAWNRRSEV